MWPLLLDMSKLDCKKSLRTLELEAYSTIISAFRAQGDLTPRKIDLLKELQTLFKISIDRHKSEVRRACNDDKLYTIAKLLSHGDCVSTEWISHSKRSIPLLPSFQATNTSTCYYRILADQILSKAEPVFSLYPEDNSIKTCDQHPQPLNDKSESESELVHLKNGYAVQSNCVKVENCQPGEFFKHMESQTSSENNKTFLNYLIQKYKQQNEQKDQANSVKTVNAIDLDAKSNAKDNQQEKSEQLCVNITEATLVDKIKAENDSPSACASTDSIQKHQTLIPIQIPFQQLQTPNLKLNPNQPFKLSPSLNSHLTSQKTPKLLIPASKTNNNPQKLIILPSNSNANSNLKILTTTQLNQKIVLNVPSVTKTVDTSKRKFCETNVKTSVSNSNLVCLKLDNFNDESNSSTSSKNGFYDLNGSNSKKIKLIEFNQAQGTLSNLIKTNSNSNLTSAD